MKQLSKYAFAILLVLAGLKGQSQQIIWEKKIGWIASQDVITSVCQADSGGYLALGYSDRHLIGSSIVTGYGFNVASIIKFNSRGDTLFSKELNLYCQSWGTPYIGRFWNNQYVAVINVEMPNGPSSSQIKRFPAVLLINEQGEVMQTRFFPQHEFCIINGVSNTSDFGFVLSGYKSSLNIFHTDSMFAMKVNFLLEQEWANKYTNLANAAYRGEHLEPMANGHYLVSGKLGKRIYGMELDSNGLIVNEKIYHSNPSNRVFNAAQVRQDWRKGTVSFGYFEDGSSTYWGYFGRYDSLSNKVWGGQTEGNVVLDVIMNRENSFLIGQNSQAGIKISRITRDSTVLWNLSLGGNGQPYRIMHGMQFTTPDTGIAFGFYKQQGGNLGNQFWIAKIAGVGTGYDPVNPWDTVITNSKSFFQPKDTPKLYPNPVSESFRFTQLTQSAIIGIYNLQGQKLLEKTIQPEEKVSVSHLPKGMYLYHLRMGEKVFTGRLKKNDR